MLQAVPLGQSPVGPSSGQMTHAGITFFHAAVSDIFIVMLVDVFFTPLLPHTLIFMAERPTDIQSSALQQHQGAPADGRCPLHSSLTTYQHHIIRSLQR
jgi:hypothetical protein